MRHDTARWARFPDTWWIDDRIETLRFQHGQAGLAAIGLHQVAVTYSLRYNTNGELHHRVLEYCAGGPGRRWRKLAALLVEVGLLEVTERGWRILGFHSFGEGERQAIPPHTRRYVISRDGYICGICGDDVEPRDLHIDHIVPVVRGGSNDADNLQVAHARCNMRKGASY